MAEIQAAFAEKAAAVKSGPLATLQRAELAESARSAAPLSGAAPVCCLIAALILRSSHDLMRRGAACGGRAAVAEAGRPQFVARSRLAPTGPSATKQDGEEQVI